MRWGLFILVIVMNTFVFVSAEDSTYTHIKGFSEFSLNRQSVSGSVSGYELLPYSNRNNRTNLRIESSMGNDLYFSGNVVSDQTAFQEGIYSFSLRHRLGMAKIGQFTPEIDVLPDRTVMKGMMLKGNYGNNELNGQYFYDNIALTRENIRGNGTQGPFKLKHTDIINGSEDIKLIDEHGVRRALKRNNDYTINYIPGEVELNNIVLENKDLLVINYETKNSGRYAIKEGKYNYQNHSFNFSIRGLKEDISKNDSIKNNKNIDISGKYHNDYIAGDIKLGRSFVDSLMPTHIEGDFGYSASGLHIGVNLKREDEGYSLFNNANQLNYGFQAGYHNNLTKIECNYNNSISDSIGIKRFNFISGLNVNSNLISYNYAHLWMDSYESEKHYLELSSVLSYGKIKVSSGLGNMKIDSLKNRNYFVNGSINFTKNANVEITTENRFEIYEDSSLYRYKQHISVAKNWSKSNLLLNMGLLNDNNRRNIPYGMGKISVTFMNAGILALNFNAKRMNGSLDSTDIPVNRIDFLPKITLNGRYIKVAYIPQFYYGIYGDNLIQERRVLNGGSISLALGKLFSNLEYYHYSNINFDLNNLNDKKTDNYGERGRYSVNTNISSKFSIEYGFDYNKDNGLFNVIIPTESDTSGDTLNIVKVSRRLRHNLGVSYKRGKSLLNMKMGYENDDKYHSDTLYQDFKMIDETAEVGKTFIEGLGVFAGVYINAKKGFDMEIAQDSGWSYSIGPQFRAKYDGKYGSVYSAYKYIQSYGTANAKINEFKLGGNLRINMLGISADCLIRNGVIPVYNVKRISGKVGVYF